MPELSKQFAQYPALNVSKEQARKFQIHFERILVRNPGLNLISKGSAEHAFESHYADSILASDFIEKHLDNLVVRELGSGAGFPGIVFAIRNPHKKLEIYEKHREKREFLISVVEELGLEKVTVGSAFPEGQRHQFILSRAVFPPDRLLTFCKQRLTSGGRFLMMTGDRELEVAPGNAFKLVSKCRYELPLGAGFRRGFIFELVSRGTKKR